LTLSGRPVPLAAELAGTVALIDLWATWCTACQREQPKLERLHAAYADRGVRVIGVDVGEAPDVVREYLAKRPVSYPVYLDPDFRIADALGEHELPTLLLVDRNGRIVRRSGTLDAGLLRALKALVQAPPASL